MSIPVSTFPTAIAAIISQTQTQVNTDSLASQIVVTWGEPGMDLPNDIIMIGVDHTRKVNPEVLIGSYQTGSLKEAYTIDCLASSWSGDADPVALGNRAWVLAGYIETAVRTDPSLGTSVLEAHPSGTKGQGPTWTIDPIGRLCQVTVTIEVFTLN